MGNPIFDEHSFGSVGKYIISQDTKDFKQFIMKRVTFINVCEMQTCNEM